MPRAHVVDLRYEHEMRPVSAHAATPSQPSSQGLGLVARLRGLKALMDAERGQAAGWMPRAIYS